MSKIVKVTYNSDTLETTITVNGQSFDTSRINGKEIADWAYPFMIRKIRWNGFYEEMVEALGGEKEFNLIFEGLEEALSELKEAWEDAPVSIVEECSDNSEVTIEYDAENFSTKITVNEQPFDTSRIDGREIEDWVYPFQIRKVKWNGIFDELSAVIDSESFTIEFIGDEKWLEVLNEECPETVTIIYKSNTSKVEISEKDILLSKLCAALTNRRYYLQRDPKYLYNQAKNCSDKNQAFELYKKSADMGNIIAQLETGKCYYNGNGTEKNYNKALAYFKKAADKGNPEAQLETGRCYYDKKIYNEAFKYFEKSAGNGNPKAQYYVGEIYYNGFSVMQSYWSAIRYYKKAAEKGDTSAMCKLGISYCKVNKVESAKEWLEKAIQAGCENSKELEELKKLTRPKSAEELYNEAKAIDNTSKKVFEMYKQSADLGHTKAQLETGRSYFYGWGTEEDNEKAFEYFKKAADKNDADAQYYLGVLYYNGYGIKQNYSESVKCYTKAANNGNLDAMNRLGDCYQDGNGVKKNLQQAVSWYRKGSDKGHAGCQYELGLCYWEGNGTKQNKNFAFDLFQKSAKQGYSWANNKLGLIYNNGYGRKADKQKAIEYYQIAAEAGLAVSMYNLGILYSDENNTELAREWFEKALEAGFEDAEKMLEEINNPKSEQESAEDLYNEAEALLNEDLFNEKAFDLLKQSADLGHTEAQVATGEAYFYGFGTEEDDEKAFEYFKKAADKNHAEAQYWIGEMYYNGNGVKENDYEAVKWYTKAANNGNTDAMEMLGQCYTDGDGVKKNLQQAVSWYRKGSDKGHAGCQYNLGMCYWEGNGTKQNRNFAFDLFQKSAKQGYSWANNKLGLIYNNGDGRKADKQKATEYYRIAAEAGLAVAMNNLGVILYEEYDDVESAREWLEKALEAGYEDAQKSLDVIFENTDDEYDDSGVQDLGIDFPEPMDTTYYPEKHEDYYFANNEINFNPYGIDVNRNFIYSLFFYLDVNSGNKFMEILNDATNYAQTGKTNYDSVNDCFNELIECRKIDASEETENKRAENARLITGKLYSYFGSNILTNALKEIHKTVNEMYDFIDNKYHQNIYNQISREEYVEATSELFSLNDKLNNMIGEISSDMNANKNKVFSYFHEVEDTIIKVLHFKIEFANSEYDYNYTCYESEYKSADIKSTATAVGGGALFGLLSFIPAINDGIDNVSNKCYDTANKMFTSMQSTYQKRFKEIIYLSVVVLALDSISSVAVEWLIDDDNPDDDCDDFFDEI